MKQHFKITIKPFNAGIGKKPFSCTIQGNVTVVLWSV